MDKITAFESSPGGAPVVLLVEDEVLIRLALAEELRDAGLSVIEASNVDEALTVLGRHSVDLVITDVNMPGTVDGIELARFVKANRPETKVFVWSGHIDLDSVTGVADRFFRNPFDYQEVCAAVLGVVARNAYSK